MSSLLPLNVLPWVWYCMSNNHSESSGTLVKYLRFCPKSLLRLSWAGLQQSSGGVETLLPIDDSRPYCCQGRLSRAGMSILISDICQPCKGLLLGHIYMVYLPKCKWAALHMCKSSRTISGNATFDIYIDIPLAPSLSRIARGFRARSPSNLREKKKVAVLPLIMVCCNMLFHGNCNTQGCNQQR